MAEVKEEKEMLNLNVVSNRVSENCRCNELEERSRKAEVRCAELEFELQKKQDHCDALEAKVKTLEGEKFAVEDELNVLRMLSDGPKRYKEASSEKERVMKVVDLTEDNEAVQLTIENKVLECEKNRAESEVEVWKEKYKKLESWALQLGMGRGSYCHEEDAKKQEDKQISTEGKLHLDTSFDFRQNQKKVVGLGNVVYSCISPSKEIGGMPSAGTPPDGIFQKTPILDSMVQPGREVIKQLTFETEESPNKKMAPSTPIGAKSTSVSVINIIDSDDEPNITQDIAPDRQGSGNISLSTCFAAEKGKSSDSNYAQHNEENLDYSENLLFAATPKRKRACNVVISESESDDEDDNMPICELKRMHIQKVSADQVRSDFNSSLTATISEVDNHTDTIMTRRRLQPLRKCVSKCQDDTTSSSRPHKVKHQQSIQTNDDAESEVDLSDSEGGNMSDFIVDDSDVSNCEATSSKSQDGSNVDVDSDSCNSQDLQDSDKDSDSQDVSDGDMDFGKILSRIRRSKNNKMKWEFEADMLAAFGKDPELCMKAVCALYRQQTAEEQMSKGTLYHNQRGFSKFDAHRGSTLAEFLTDGDPHGGLKKTVEELQGYDTKAVELCRSLAIHYSKQLYEIYKNKEDPLFP